MTKLPANLVGDSVGSASDGLKEWIMALNKLDKDEAKAKVQALPETSFFLSTYCRAIFILFA
jgi:hypothetical protein